MKSISNVLKVSLLIAAVFFVASSITSNSILQPALAQFPPGGTFSAKGFAGQTVVLPSAWIPKPGQPMRPPVGTVLGGNWSFAVSNGLLQSFKWDVNAFGLNGKVNGTYSINNLTKVTGATPEHPARDNIKR